MQEPDNSNEPPEPLSPGACDIELSIQTSSIDPPIAGWIELHLGRLAALEGVEDGRISLAVVNDERMIQLNDQYAGKQTTTDVLSFDLRDESQDRPASPGVKADVTPDQCLDAEIIICLDQAARQASMRQHDIRMELLLYALHGMLHLLGYDDHTEQQAQRMHEREDDLLTQAGFGPVYHTELQATEAQSEVSAAPASGVR